MLHTQAIGQNLSVVKDGEVTCHYFNLWKQTCRWTSGWVLPKIGHQGNDQRSGRKPPNL